MASEFEAMTDRFELAPGLGAWRAALPDLKKRGNELKGPCPSCGGTDRFWVKRGSAGNTVFGCRGCDPRRTNPDAFKAILHAVFPPPPDRRHSSSQTRPKPNPTKPRVDTDKPRERQVKIETAQAIWARAGPADDTLGRVYLAQRMAWPPAGIGPDPPSVVRWLPSDLAPAANEAADWYGLPRWAAGAVVFAWFKVEVFHITHKLQAVSLEALRADGQRPDQVATGKRWRRTVGNRTGTLFRTRAGDVGEPINAAEGEVDALALALAPWCAHGSIVAVGGTSGMKRCAELIKGDVILHSDYRTKGRLAARAAAEAIETNGGRYYIEWYTPDPAQRLADLIGERIAIKEYDGGEDRAAAKSEAWDELLHST